MIAGLVVALVEAADPVSPSPVPSGAGAGGTQRYIDPQSVTPGFWGFFFFVALGVATYFLWRSMNRQLKRIDFDEGDTSAVRVPNRAFDEHKAVRLPETEVLSTAPKPAAPADPTQASGR